jgi:hypothetical protein
MNLHMAWNCFLPCPVSPDIMPLPVSQKPPPELMEGSLQLSPLHALTVHLCVYILKSRFAAPAPQLVELYETFETAAFWPRYRLACLTSR